MAAAAGPVEPISVPTALGARETIDVGVKTLNLQRLENPQTSLHQCASRYGSQLVRSIFEKLEQKDKVSEFVELNLSDNNIGDDGARWLMQGLTGTTQSGQQVGQNLKVLLMPRTRLKAAGMKAMGELVGASRSLENVVLSGNDCDAEGVEGEFCAGLSMNKSIKSLCLAACRLADRGVAVLSDGPLRSHPTLEHLSLQYNRLNAASAQSLANALAVNQALRYLDLSGNSLGPDGALALLAGVKRNKGRLTRLSLSQNEIQPTGAKAFCEHFMSPDGKTIVYLDLRHNAIPYPDMVKLRTSLGKPMDGPEGWMLLFGERQLLLNR